MKRIAYIILLFFYLLLVNVIGRGAFLYYNRTLSFFQMKDVVKVELLGLPMDMVVASALMLVPILLTLLSLKWEKLPMRRTAGILLWVAVFVAVCFTCADFIMYEHWKFKLDASVFAYMSEPGEMSSSTPMSYLVSRIGLSVLAAFIAGLLAFLLTPKTFQVRRRRHSRKVRGWVVCLVGIIFALPFVLGLSGVIGEELAFRKIQFAGKRITLHHKIFLSNAAVNPVYHIAHSVWLYSKDADRQFPMMDRKEARALTSRLFPADTEDITDTLLTTTRPNILTLQIESMGAVFVEELGGKYGEGAGMFSSEQETVTPELCCWMQLGLNFTRAYASSFRTDRGTVSVISGALSYPTVSLMMEDSVLALMEQGRGIAAIPSTLRRAGYSTCYLYGGDQSFMNKGRYLSAAGYERVMGIEDIDVEKSERDQWGANDSIAFERLFSYVTSEERKTPWCVGFQTLSSHEPWKVPYERLRDRILNAFAYTDHCLGRFLDRLSHTPVWDNTLVIIFADHGYPYNQFYDRPDFFHIPLLFVGGALKRTGNVETLISQSDIAATVLSQMNITHRQFPYSRNIFSSRYVSPCVYATYPAGVMLMDERGFSMYDHQSGVFISETDTLREKQLKAILQDSYENL